ncbi:MAG: molybdenum cofactor guanylyltransferase [Elusimicrobia bacterium]|nr:molybdenum cofactor guanylyltransferase [Elusimicrobiota bacterium]
MILPGTGAVLAGGRSLRFGSPKAHASWGAGSLVEAVASTLARSFAETLVVVKIPAGFERLERAGCRVVVDLDGEQHPLGGLDSCLAASAFEHVLVAACDMPALRPALLERLWASRGSFEAVVPLWNGVPQPLCALYTRACRARIRGLIARKALSLRGLLGLLRTRYLSEAEVAEVDPSGASFADLDTREEYERLRLEAGC